MRYQPLHKWLEMETQDPPVLEPLDRVEGTGDGGAAVVVVCLVCGAGAVVVVCLLCGSVVRTALLTTDAAELCRPDCSVCLCRTGTAGVTGGSTTAASSLTDCRGAGGGGVVVPTLGCGVGRAVVLGDLSWTEDRVTCCCWVGDLKLRKGD